MRISFALLFFLNNAAVFWTNAVNSHPDGRTPNSLYELDGALTPELGHKILEALQSIQASVSSLSGRVESSERIMHDLRQQVNSVQSGITSLSGQVGHSERHSAELKESMRQQISKIEKLAAEFRGNKTSGQMSSSQTQSAGATNETRIRQCSTEVSGISTKLRQCESQLKNLTSPGVLGNCIPSLDQRPVPTENKTEHLHPGVEEGMENEEAPNCGGVVRLAIDTPITIQHESRSEDDYDVCVWSFLPDSPADSYDYIFESANFEYEDDGLGITDTEGIVFYSWNGTGTITVSPEGYGKGTLHGNYLFFALSSDGSNTYPGFRMRVTARSNGSSSTSLFTYSAVSLTGSTGAISLPNPTDQGRSRYISNERISAVLGRSKTNGGRFIDKVARITSLDTEFNRDFLYVFPLRRFEYTSFYNWPSTAGTFNLTGFSGSSSLQVPHPGSQVDVAMLYLFTSDESTHGNGFSLAWSKS